MDNKPLAQKCQKITNKTSKQTSNSRKTKQKIKLPRRWKKLSTKISQFGIMEDGNKGPKNQ